ncbi:DUF1642 domain-containing protein [Enterococcus faecium]|uniref:DUF1642 domain-containing protein n=1 Tax=Enterococcus faecium TaxID=1352 RepID=UPI00339B765D
MNKQETIKKLESIKAIGNDAIAACYNESINAGITLMKQLDEPQKPVVPKFVAEWFEDNKHALDLAIFTKIRELDGKNYPHETDFENWLDNAENNPIENLIRMKDGYEFEKEPLYYVRLPYEVWDEEEAELKTEYLYLHYEITSDETRIFPAKEPRKGFVAKLDELTIKSADEKYWPFAVPVEEVVER